MLKSPRIVYDDAHVRGRTLTPAEKRKLAVNLNARSLYQPPKGKDKVKLEQGDTELQSGEDRRKLRYPPKVGNGDALS